MHGPAESCKASLRICILIQETKEGLATILPSMPLQPQVHRAQPCIAGERGRLGLNTGLIDCCLQPHFFFFFVPQVPPAISTGAFQIPSVMCASSLKKTKKYFIECSGTVRVIKLVCHAGVFNTISRSLAKPATARRSPKQNGVIQFVLKAVAQAPSDGNLHTI